MSWLQYLRIHFLPGCTCTPQSCKKKHDHDKVPSFGLKSVIRIPNKAYFYASRAYCTCAYITTSEPRFPQSLRFPPSAEHAEQLSTPAVSIIETILSKRDNCRRTNSFSFPTYLGCRLDVKGVAINLLLVPNYLIKHAAQK